METELASKLLRPCSALSPNIALNAKREKVRAELKLDKTERTSAALNVAIISDEPGRIE